VFTSVHNSAVRKVYHFQTISDKSKDYRLKCNPHGFRRGFAVHQVKSGLSNKVIQTLGGWESADMVSHYAASLTFDEALRLYTAVNSNG
jgi:integrase